MIGPFKPPSDFANANTNTQKSISTNAKRMGIFQKYKNLKLRELWMPFRLSIVLFKATQLFFTKSQHIYAFLISIHAEVYLYQRMK